MATITQSNDESTDAGYGFAPRLLLASLAVAAGGVHLAMAPIHASSSATEAAGFATAGWLQILLGFAILMRPSRFVLGATIAVNAAIIIGYIVSRTAGLPFGDNAWVAEDVQGIDLMVTIFEAALIAGAAVLMIWPRFGASGESDGAISFETLAIASAIPLLVLVATSVALSDPDLTTHSHGGDALVAADGGHPHDGSSGSMDAQLVALADTRCDLGLNPAAYWREASMAGVDTIMGGEVVDSHDHATSASIQGSPELDKLVSQHVTAKGEGGDAAMVVSLAKVSDDVYDNWLRWMATTGMSNHAHGGNVLAPDDKDGMGGHLGPQPWHAMTDSAQCEQLASELALARATALKYPTVKDAEAAGWVQVTPYVPGIAAHFMNFGLVDGKFEIDKPEMILYDGTGDDARVVGLSYYIRQDGGAEPTQGFTGSNDHYHRHVGLCIDETGVIGDSTTTEEDCAAMGGRKAQGGDGWMSHAWVVPGCESPWGVFSGATPILDPSLFEDNGASGTGCAGSDVRARYDLDPGQIENTPTEVGGAVELASAGN